jgi:long-chain acyl-CoA synthetase
MSALKEQTAIDAAGTTRTFVGPQRRAATVAAGDVAVLCGEETFTHAQLQARVLSLIGALRAMGLKDGDRVGVVGPNCHRYLELYLAVPAAGLVLVPLNARHAEPEMRYSLDDSGARVLFAPSDKTEMLGDAVEHAVSFDRDYERLLSDAEPGAYSEVAEQDLAGIFYTGGTTGAAKGVMLTHGNIIANAMHFMVAWRFDPEMRWLVVAPMFHAAGTIAVLATIWGGGRQVILPAFDPAAALDAIEREKITATLVVPTMMAALTAEQKARPRDVSSLKWLSHGASPVATQTLRDACDTFPDASMLHIYGATETAPILTLLPDEQRYLDKEQSRSCGQPAVGIDIEVVSPEREPLPAGTVGEVRARGANITQGYWNKPEETANALQDGWYHSGDLGYLDDQGFLFLVDRAKDMIVSGAENVYSTEVEDALYKHPAVAEAAVFGMPDERWGEAVCAAIVLNGDATEEDLVAHCRPLIAGYKIPRRIFLRSEPLPKSAAGKILKRELRDEYQASE